MIKLRIYGTKSHKFGHIHFKAEQLQNLFHCSILAYRLEARFLKTGTNPLLHGTIAPTRWFTHLIPQNSINIFRYAPVEADILIDRPFDMAGLGFTGEIVSTPGHSPGSLSVLIDHEIAVVGDAMFGFFPGSVFPPYAADTNQMVNSWKTLLEIGCVIFLPAHGSQRSRDLLEKSYLKRK